MASLLGLYGGGAGRRRSGRGGGAWRSSSAPVRQLLRRLRSSLRGRAARPRRRPAAFGYDLQSYSRNFDDGLGLGSSGRRL